MKSWNRLWCILAFSAAMVVFALTAHHEPWFPARLIALSVAGGVLMLSLTITDDLRRTIFGEPRKPYQSVQIVAVVALGVAAAVGYRELLQTTLVPRSLHWFAAFAMMVGATEELVWRGWMQGNLMESMSWKYAVAITAASHAAYKTALFSFPPADVAMRPVHALLLMTALTFSFGSLLGVFRCYQGTIGGPVVFHVVFDLLVYGDYAQVPWWVS